MIHNNCLYTSIASSFLSFGDAAFALDIGGLDLTPLELAVDMAEDAAPFLGGWPPDTSTKAISAF